MTDRMNIDNIMWWVNAPDDAVGAHHAAKRLADEARQLTNELSAALAREARVTRELREAWVFIARFVELVEVTHPTDDPDWLAARDALVDEVTEAFG